MIFMSQSGLLDARREAEWDEWYVEHLRIMGTVPGVLSVQRFKTATPNYSPSLAMYTFTSGEIFSDPYYLSIRGMGEWQTLIDKRWYRRNLFHGLDAAPDVAMDQCLLVADRDQTENIAAAHFTWLHAVAIDKSTPYRGIAVVNATIAHSIPDNLHIAVYRPATPWRKGTDPR